MSRRTPTGHPSTKALDTRSATLFAVLGSALVFLGCTGALGAASGTTFSIVGSATVAAFVVGIWRNHPASPWGWVITCAALILFVAGGAEREALHTLGNLTAGRSMIPDLITLPGYVLLGIGSIVMGAAGRAHRADPDVILDAVIAALGVLVLEWAYLIAPALAHTAVPLRVRILLAIYPAMSAFLVAVRLQIVFRGRAHRVRSQQYLAASFLALVIGDVLYTLADTRLVQFHGTLLDIPYGLAFIAAGSSVLHPSVAERIAPLERAGPKPTFSRLVFVSAALGLPAIVTAFGPSSSKSDRTVVSLLALALAACAIWRVMRALGAHAQAQLQLMHQATHDMLTGLPNRRITGAFVAECLARSQVSGKIVAVLFLDVDRFKMVNDSFGHSIGDELLLAVARRLQGDLHATDLVARLGGDEFIIVVDGLRGASDAIEIALRIHGMLRTPFTVEGVEIFVTVSIGVACGSGTVATDSETLIRDADLAMYQAKGAGRDGVSMYSEDVHGEVAERLRIERDLRHALDRQELAVHYQPIVSLDTGAIDGFEALLRWSHPIDGPMSPAEFIPIAEETGLIGQIGEWVLDEACATMAGWRRMLPESSTLSVAVNVSARQFRNGELVEIIKTALRVHHLPPGALRIELTESMLLSTSDDTITALNELRRIGVGISIDDFGTGYSSLAYLQRYPVDCVKIDRAFVVPLSDDDSPEESLVAAIIAMCGALRMKTVAEGIETERQRRKLTDIGCDSGQGWLFAKAMPAADASALLSSEAVSSAAMPLGATIDRG